MANPVSFFSMTVNDNTLKKNGEPESATWSVPITTITPANEAAVVSAVTDLIGAVNGVIIGLIAKNETTLTRNIVGTGPAISNLAQRENKFLIRYHGVTLLKKFRTSLPTADLTLLPDHEEFLDLTADPGLALKTAFQAIVKSPDDGAEGVVLDSIQFVGRNT